MQPVNSPVPRGLGPAEFSTVGCSSLFITAFVLHGCPSLLYPRFYGQHCSILKWGIRRDLLCSDGLCSRSWPYSLMILRSTSHSPALTLRGWGPLSYLRRSWKGVARSCLPRSVYRANVTVVISEGQWKLSAAWEPCFPEPG